MRCTVLVEYNTLGACLIVVEILIRHLKKIYPETTAKHNITILNNRFAPQLSFSYFASRVQSNEKHEML